MVNILVFSQVIVFTFHSGSVTILFIHTVFFSESLLELLDTYIYLEVFLLS